MAVETEAIVVDKTVRDIMPQNVHDEPSAIMETITVSVVTFNSLRRYLPQAKTQLTLPKESTVLDVVCILEIPPREVFTVWVNGLYPNNDTTNLSAPLRHGDRVALSGPIPFSQFYKAPVC